MKYLKYLPYFLLIIAMIYGFKTNTIKDQFQKMKTLMLCSYYNKHKVKIILIINLQVFCNLKKYHN